MFHIIPEAKKDISITIDNIVVYFVGAELVLDNPVENLTYWS